jgi:hypothetical protein
MNQTHDLLGISERTAGEGDMKFSSIPSSSPSCRSGVSSFIASLSGRSNDSPSPSTFFVYLSIVLSPDVSFPAEKLTVSLGQGKIM